MRTLLALLLSVSNRLVVGLTAWESIHQTIHTYPLVIDSKDFALLSKVCMYRICCNSKDLLYS